MRAPTRNRIPQPTYGVIALVMAAAVAIAALLLTTR